MRNLGLTSTILPIGDRIFRNIKYLRHIGLEQPELLPALADMLTDGLRVFNLRI